jgi:hypothetical protein
MSDPLPELRDGFNMSVSEHESSMGLDTPDTTTELPPEFRDIENPLATVAPHVSQFVVRVDPSKPVHLRYFQTFGLAEEMMHGRRHRFGLTRSHHLLRMRSIGALFDMIDDPTRIGSAAERIVEAEQAIETLHERRFSFLEGVDKYLCQSVMSEEGYLDRHVDQYMSLDEAADRGTVERRFERLREFLTRRARDEDADVFDKLAGLERDYGRRITELAADAALDTPYLVGPHDIDGFDAVPADDLSLRDRLDAAVAAVRTIDPSDVDEESEQALLATIEDELSGPVRGAGGVHPRELDLPLLDIPQSIESTDLLRNKYDVVLEAPTEMGQIVNAAFRFTGNFGGVVYRIETGDDVQPNWLVNPLVAEEPVPDDAFGVPVDTVGTYKRLWERVYFGNELLDTLLGMVGQDVDDPVACPLCGISVAGTCHPDGCPSTQLVGAVREHKHRIVRALERAR